MNGNNPEQVRKSSVDALKMVYYVIVGLAITVALDNTFLKKGAFVGFECYTNDDDVIFVLMAFLCTNCRFVNGASLHLDSGLEKRWKPLFDFLAFFLQGALFYLMALSLNDVRTFTVLLGLMLLCDAVWLLVLRLMSYLPEPQKTANQWLLSDFLFVAALFSIYITDRNCGCIPYGLGIFVIATIAAIWDYASNREFYFPASADGADG